MKTLIFSAAALAIAAPAFAQTNTTADGAAPAPAPAAQAATPTDPATILKNEFPVYDKDANGELSKEEFSNWLTALKAASPQKTEMTAAQQTQWLDKSFSDADKDKSTAVNLAELTNYLTQKS